MIGISEYYSAELSQKVRRGQIENLKKGKWLGGQILYGYKAENKRLVIDEEKAKIVIYIFEQYFAGKIVPDIIKDLTEKGIYHLGKPFKKCVLYYILSNEKYSGIFRYQDEIYDNVYPKIVPDYLFNAVQSMMAKNKLGRNSKDMIYYLRGNVLYANGHTKSKLELKQSNQCKSKSRDSLRNLDFLSTYLER